MKTNFVFVFMTLALILAACGAPSTPTAAPTAMP